MSKAKITLIGFNYYMESVNDDLFKNLSVPTGIDKNTLINNILLKGGEFEVLYAEPYFMQQMIGVWSNKWQRTMERWIKALSIDYNPLENYDRMEDWTDDASKVASAIHDETASNSASNIGINTHSDNKEETNSEETSRSENAVASDFSTSTGEGKTENGRSAYNSNIYSPHDDSNTETSGENNSTGVTSADGKTETDTKINGSNSAADVLQNQSTGDESKKLNTNAIDNSSSTHTGRLHGNIGVTTSQQMLQAELDISKWNLYDEIADLFISEFCIYLY